MLKQASWTHGNSVVVQTPENCKSIQPFGWGTELFFIPGRESWCHIPIPTPAIMSDQRANVQTLYLLYRVVENGQIVEVHIWDGSVVIQQYRGIGLAGDHRDIDDSSTFTLGGPHEVKFGMSISFLCQTNPAAASPVQLTITGAGADFF